MLLELWVLSIVEVSALEPKPPSEVKKVASYGQFLSYLCNFKTFMTEAVIVLGRYGDDARWGRGNGIFLQGAEGERNNSTNAAA